MSNRTDRVNLIVTANGDDARNKLNNLQKEAASLQQQMEGLKKKSQEYLDKKAKYDELTESISALKKEIGLAALTQSELIEEIRSLERMRGATVPFSNEYKELSARLGEAKNRLYEVRNGVTGIGAVFSKVKDEVKQFGLMAVGYLGFQFITDQFKNIISSGAKLSDQLADLRRVSGLSAEEVNSLNKSLGGLQTRTSTGGLRDIAIIAGKLGVAKNDILGFTAAVDQMVVALGDELGDADSITTELGKILNVFEGGVSSDSMSKLGNAVVVLGNAGVSTGRFISDFTQRVAGINNAAGISLGSTVGLAAGLEELGLRSESGATAIQTLLSNINKDLPNAAKAAGLALEEFKKLSPEEQLLKYAEGLTKNKSSFAEVVASFKSAGEEGARVVTTLQAIGQRADFMRSKIELGRESIKETTAINEAFALKNQTLGASVDMLSKQFAKFTNSQAVTSSITAIINGLNVFLKVLVAIPGPILQITAALGLMVTALMIKNTEMYKSAKATAVSTAEDIKNAVANRAKAIATALSTSAARAAMAADYAYATAKQFLTKEIGLAVAAQRIWIAVTSMSLGPIALLVIAVAALTAGIAYMAGAFDKVITQQSLLNNVMTEANKETAKQRAELESLSKVASETNISLSTRKQALEKLISISPEYLGRLNLENIATQEGKNILEQYNKALMDSARLKAAKSVVDKQVEKTAELINIKTELEFANATHDFRNLSKETKNFIWFKGGNDLKKIDELINYQQKLTEFALDNVTKLAEKHSANRRAALTHEITIALKMRREFLDKYVTDGLSEAEVKTSEAFQKIDKRYRDLQATYNREFGFRDKVTPTDDKVTPTGGGNTPTDPDADKKRQKEVADEKRKQQQLLEQAAAFRKRLDEIMKNTGNKTLAERERELKEVEDQYNELTQLAIKHWAKNSDAGKKALADIEKIRSTQLQGLYAKFMSEDADKEYADSLKYSEDYFEQYKNQQTEAYIAGKLSKQQYEDSLKDIDVKAAQQKAQIASDYSETSKKAAKDEVNFKKEAYDKDLANHKASAEKKKQQTVDEELAGLRLNVITSPKGSKTELEAKQALLRRQFQLDTEYMDQKSAMYLEKEAQLNKSLEELAQAHFQSKMEKAFAMIGYFQQALGLLNTILVNSEKRMLAREKKDADDKGKKYKQQLDQKLMSQAQYDRKMAALQEKQDKRQKEVARKQAEREKAMALFSATVNLAKSVMQTFAANGGWPAGIIPAAIMGVLGGLQIAAISNQPLPELGRGGLLTEGPYHRDPERGLNVVNPRTGRTIMRLERDEAVLTGAAMRSNTNMTLSGTPRQIASQLNTMHGGVSFAGRTMPKWNSTVPNISTRTVRMMAKGGMVGDTQDAGAGEMENLLRTMIAEQQAMRTDMANWKQTLKAYVVLKEVKEQDEKLSQAQRAASIK